MFLYMHVFGISWNFSINSGRARQCFLGVKNAPRARLGLKFHFLRNQEMGRNGGVPGGPQPPHGMLFSRGIYPANVTSKCGFQHVLSANKMG